MSNYGFTAGASGYDDADRLKNWNRSDGGLDHSWDLSLVGDWNSQTENTQSTSFTHNNVHELTAVGSTPLAYDIKGNLTTNQNGHTYTWDFNNRMEGADTDSDSVDDLHFTYDAIGRRVSRNDGTTNTIFVSSGQQVIAEYLSGSQPTSPTEQYVYASYIDEPLITIGTGGTLYYHRNRQYSIVALSDPTGNIVEQYAYTSTGVTTTLDANTNPIPTTTKNNPYTYTSRRLDPTLNLHYFRARWFDSELSRFTNRDPLEYNDGMSLYRGYFMPIGMDPSGLFSSFVPAEKCRKRMKRRKKKIDDLRRRRKDGKLRRGVGDCRRNSKCEVVTIVIELAHSCSRSLVGRYIGHTGIGIGDDYYVYGPDGPVIGVPTVPVDGRPWWITIYPVT